MIKGHHPLCSLPRPAPGRNVGYAVRADSIFKKERRKADKTKVG